MKKNDASICTLREWLLEHNVNKDKDKDIPEFKNLIYHLDFTMKNLHHAGEFITSFNIDDILVSGQFVKYTRTSKLYYEDRDYLIHKNIIYLSCFALGVYNDCLNYINPDNLSGIKENFSAFSMFIPEDVVPYYKGIFQRDANVYLSDYVKAKVERDRIRDVSMLNQDGSSNNKNISTYSKSTLAGRLFADDNKAAFIQLVLFPVIILLLAILIPIMIILGT